MTKRPMLPSELNTVRSAYRRAMVNQRQHELESNAEDVKTCKSLGSLVRLRSLRSCSFLLYSEQHTFSSRDHKFEHAKTVSDRCDICSNRAGFS